MCVIHKMTVYIVDHEEWSCLTWAGEIESLVDSGATSAFASLYSFDTSESFEFDDNMAINYAYGCKQEEFEKFFNKE